MKRWSGLKYTVYDTGDPKVSYEPGNPCELESQKRLRLNHSAKTEARRIYADYGIRVPWQVIRDGMLSHWWALCREHNVRHIPYDVFKQGEGAVHAWAEPNDQVENDPFGGSGCESWVGSGGWE